MTGLEPATSGSQNQHSTTELHPGTRSIIRHDRSEVKVKYDAGIAVMPQKAVSALIRSGSEHVFKYIPEVCGAFCKPAHKVRIPVCSEGGINPHAVPIFH